MSDGTKKGQSSAETSHLGEYTESRKLGVLTDRVHRELTDDEIERIAGTYHEWRSKGKSKYEDVAGFCMSASLDDIRKHGHVLTPGRYVGAEDVEDDGEPFEEKMPRLVAMLNEHFDESTELERTIRSKLAVFSSETLGAQGRE